MYWRVSKVLVAKNFIVVSDMNIMLTAKGHVLIGEKDYCGVLRYRSFNQCEDSRDRKHPITEVNYRSGSPTWQPSAFCCRRIRFRPIADIGSVCMMAADD